ncbi:hypothetical protein P154DRAFT_520117 [Amniculicola lignicola CBS 123094]|uniref:Uncharacterized protein n=1 Tax=Amniculicola lignicola CBS 123094 TaxID=1392246 RepID=A0A6A5WPS3_9PLEO|nr:hypothetical protein P154DRAFT_520117 [Amniculicola lignicola CBS 123094]
MADSTYFRRRILHWDRGYVRTIGPKASKRIAPSTTPPQTSTPSRFCSLPGEIRNLIYHFAIYLENVVLIAVFFANPDDSHKTLLSSPIFQVNHQIRSETIAFLCSSKQFKIYGIQSAVSLFRSIQPAGLQNLKHVTLSVSEASFDNLATPFCELLRQAQQLRVFALVLHKLVETSEWPFFSELKKVIDGLEDVHFTWTVFGGGPDRREKVREMASALTLIFGEETPYL